MREALPAVAVLLVALGLAVLRPLPVRAEPQRLPRATCATWMADAIPGVGPKRREDVAAGIRAGRVPPAAEDWFSP